MRPILTDRVAWSVGLSVTLVSPAKTAALIELPLGLRTWVGPRNHVLDGVQIQNINTAGISYLHKSHWWHFEG